MSVADPLIQSIHITAEIMTMMAAAGLHSSGERQIVGILVENYGTKKGFKVKPLGQETLTDVQLECHEVCRKLVVAGYLERPVYPEGENGEHRWTDKCKGWRDE